MKKVIYLICGVSGSGKTWICRQLSGKFVYIPHDDYIGTDLVKTFESFTEDGPFITECPFAERVLKGDLESAGFEVRPFFVYEDPQIVIERVMKRDGKMPSKSVLTRAKSIKNRIDEWKAPHGTSVELLSLLKNETLEGV